MSRKFPNIANAARGPYDHYLFREDVNEEEFRECARTMHKEGLVPETWEKCIVLHPYVRDEWHKMGVLPHHQEELFTDYPPL